MSDIFLKPTHLFLREFVIKISTAKDVQQKLNLLVSLIAKEFNKEICSLYILRADNRLELFATVGLSFSSVHVTELDVGDGIVGCIAQDKELIALPKASQHPAFAFKAETKESVDSAFMGVPLICKESLLGVLTLQTKSGYIFSEDEKDLFHTLALIVAELVDKKELQKLTAPGKYIAVANPSIFIGESIVTGVGIGYIFFHEPQMSTKNFFSENTGDELEKLNQALKKLRLQISFILQK